MLEAFLEGRAQEADMVANNLNPNEITRHKKAWDEAQNGGFGSGNVYVGAGAGEFRTGDVVGPSYFVKPTLVLSAGANPRFSPAATFKPAP